MTRPGLRIVPLDQRAREHEGAGFDLGDDSPEALQRYYRVLDAALCIVFAALVGVVALIAWSAAKALS